MYKTMGLQQRRDDLTHDQYVDHWLNVHAPMSTAVEDLLGYVSNEVIVTGEGVAVERTHPEFGRLLDGIAQLHFAEQDSLMQMAQRPEVKKWFEDGPNFVGLRTGFIAREEVLKTPEREGNPYKAFCFMKQQHSSLNDVLTSFSHAEPGLVIDHLEVATGSTNLAGFEVPDMDLAVELWGSSVEEVVGAANRLRYLVDGLAEFVGVIITFERVIKLPDQG